MACFLPNPVQGVLNDGAVDQGILHRLSAGNVKERGPDQDGENSLAGEEKHHESGKAQEDSQAVSDDLDQEGEGGMTPVPLLHNRGMDEKIIDRGPGHQKGDEQQTDQKGRH